jgi:hypothetical protein
MGMRLIEYAKAINASEEVINWLSTTAKKAQEPDDEVEHIIDWLVMTDKKKCRKLSFKDAKRLADEWSLQQQKIKTEKEDDSDTETLIDFKDGFLFKKLLTKKAFKNEGSLMSHCLGGYNPDNKDVDIFSLRDKKNKPHCTIEVRKNNKEVVQIKGKGNGSIHPDYINYVLTFFEKINFKIRKEEMKNLGYYFVYDEHLDFIKKNLSKSEKLVRIKDTNYVY